MLTRPSGSQADDLFHALVENSSDAIALLDANGVIRFASRSSARVLGYALEERLRYFVENARDIIYYCDTKGHFTYVNPTAARIMKYEAGELIGRHFMTLIRRDFRADAGDLYSRQLIERTPNTYFEFVAVTKP